VKRAIHLAILCFFISAALPSLYAQDDSAEEPLPIPTPIPRVHRQDSIAEMMTRIEETYGIGFAYPDEWIPGTPAEVIQYVDFMHDVLEALNIAAVYLHYYDNAPEDVSPSEYFRQHFDRANIQIDRVSQVEGGFIGNTLPIIEDGELLGFTMQLTYAGVNGPFILIHELGHVVDALLSDVPQNQFVDALGGAFNDIAWIPGEGYTGNEELFPRAVAGPNEEFADTFSNMLLGRLTVVPVRYDFMLEHFPDWLEAIRELPQSDE
jgi:hypothetical protein